MRLRHALLLVLLGVGACALGSGPEPERYQLQPEPDVMPVHHAGTGVLRIATPRAAANLDSDHIQLQQSDGTVSFVQNAIWNQTPATMLAPLLIHALDHSGLFHAVVDDTTTADAALELQTTVERFTVVGIEDNGAAGADPHVEIALRANLVRVADNNLVMSKVITAQAPIATIRLSVIVAAFNQALGHALGDITAAIAGAAHASRPSR